MKHYSRVAFLIVLILGCSVSPTCAARFAGSSQRFRQRSKHQHRTTRTLSCSKKDPIIQVREVLPTKLQNEMDPELNQNDIKFLRDGKSTSSSSSRRWIWWGKDMTALFNQDESRANTISKDKQEHPLRTDLWRLQVQWFRCGGSRRPLQSQKTFSMEFHENGQCRLLSHSDNKDSSSPSVLGIGSWNSRPYAVWFSVSCEEGKYICTAQLHHNPFGKHPKMQQGTILFEKKHVKQHAADVVEYDEERDRLFISPRPLQWFRPIVGKFTAVGIGVDTLDYSYSKREKRM